MAFVAIAITCAVYKFLRVHVGVRSVNTGRSEVGERDGIQRVIARVGALAVVGIVAAHPPILAALQIVLLKLLVAGVQPFVVAAKTFQGAAFNVACKLAQLEVLRRRRRQREQRHDVFPGASGVGTARVHLFKRAKNSIGCPVVLDLCAPLLRL